LSSLYLAILGSALAAEPSAAVETVLRQASEMMTHGDFERALGTLDQVDLAAASNAEAVKALLLRAECSWGMGSPAAAEKALDAALDRDPSTRLDPSEANPELVARLERLRAAHQGEVEISSEQPGLTATIDGVPVGPLPLRTRQLEGSHTIEVSGPEGSRDLRRVVVTRGKKLAVVIRDPSTRRSAPLPEPPVAVTPTAEPEGRPALVATPTLRPYAWIPAAGGAVCAVVGAGLLIRSNSLYGNLEQRTPKGEYSPSQGASMGSEGAADQAGAAVTLVLGTAALAAGVVMYLYREQAPEDGPSLSLSAVPGFAGVSMSFPLR
jgi:hypothetical protein